MTPFTEFGHAIMLLGFALIALAGVLAVYKARLASIRRHSRR